MNNSTFNIKDIKIGDHVKVAVPGVRPECFGVVENIKITVTIVYYEIKISHYFSKPRHVGKILKFPQTIVWLNNNQPDMLLKAIL